MKNLCLTFALIALMGCVATKPLPRFCGFEIGQDLDVLDAAIRQSYGLGNPATVVEAKDGFTFRQCDSVAARYGFDNFAVDVTMDGKVFGISADVKCANKAESDKKRQEIVAELKKKFGDRINDGGNIILTVNSGDDFVEVDITESKEGVEKK